MLLTIDIGNTTIALGGFAGDTLGFVRRLPSDRALDVPACAQGIRTQLALEGLSPSDLEGAVLASVVPVLTGVVCQAMEQLTGSPPLLVDRTMDTGLLIGPYDTNNLGMDRIVDCVAALARWTPPLAVFDMGTATTLSVLDADGVFQGGMILPGLRLSVEALSARAAQLPPIEFAPPQSLIGRDTVSCMCNGALYGAAGAIEGIVQRLEEELGRPLTVILTGGLGRHILPLLRRRVEYEPQLQLLGLRQLWLKHRM